MGRVAIFTVGCKVNQGESEELKMFLAGEGQVICSDPAEADLCVVNTCTVTAESDHKCRKLIRLLGRRGAKAIMVAGCYGEIAAGELERLPLVVEVIGNGGKQDWGRRVMRLLGEQPGGAQEVAGLSRTRAFIKVQDGCERKCSYCIVPKARGNEWSRPVREVLSVARKWLDVGSGEVVLCGINLGRYRPEPGIDLDALVREVLALGEGFRLRLSSIELEDMDGSWLEKWAQDKRICPHLHLPLQSGDPDILKDMGRGYRPEDFLSACRSARRAWPGLALTTDAIAGYPGESAGAFKATMRVLAEAGPARVHVFPFSARPGTAAFARDGRVAAAVVRERCGQLRRLAEECRLSYAKQRIGGRAQLLVERIREGGERVALGTTEDYLKAVLPRVPPEVRPGSLIAARVAAVSDGVAVLSPDVPPGLPA